LDIEEYNPKQHIYPNKRKSRITAFIIDDETQIQIGSTQAWLWVATEPINRMLIGVYLSRHRNTLIAEAFLRSLVELYGKHILYILRWRYLVSGSIFSSLGLKHILHTHLL
jgi:transposase-like protein